MNRYKSFSLFLFTLFIAVSCGGDKLQISGDPEAIQLAQSMLDALGGRQEWAEFKSVYVRTVSISIGQDGPLVLEEWIELDRPRVLNAQAVDGKPVFQILDGNDGWIIRESEISLISSSRITGLLDWHNHYMMRAIQSIASGGEKKEVRINGGNTFSLYENGSFIGSFVLNGKSLPVKYSTSADMESSKSILLTKWGEYKGLNYPLEIQNGSGLSIIKTDYWDPRKTDAEKAFNISFNPAEIAERRK